MLGAAVLGCVLAACSGAPPATGVVTLAVLSSPNSLDPRVGSDETSQRAHQLLYDNLLALDDQLRVTGGLAVELAAARSADLRRGLAPGRAVSRRPRADGRRRGLHVQFVHRPVVHLGAQGRVSRARQGDGARSLHGPVLAEGAVRLVPDPAGDAGRAERRRARTCATIRSAPGRTSSSALPSTTGWSWRRSRSTSAARRPTTASC